MCYKIISYPEWQTQAVYAQSSGSGYQLKEGYLYGANKLGKMEGFNQTSGSTITGFPVVSYELSDHLGSPRVVVDGHTGGVSEVYNAYAYGLRQENRTASLGTMRYAFNGQQKEDAVRGIGFHYDFGARRYDPIYGSFWSTDPLAGKYPHISPYAFVANNPIIYNDPDGKDYTLRINHETKTIVVVATYYTVKGNADTYNDALRSVKFWNDQSGKYQYAVGRGKNSQLYDVNFDLKVMEVESPSLQLNYDRQDVSISNWEKLTPDKSSNVFNVLLDTDRRFSDHENGNIYVHGITSHGNKIEIKNSRLGTDTGPHEIGHTLGLDHYTRGILTSEGDSPSRTKSIKRNYIADIIQNALTGKGHSKSNVEHKGIDPGSFNKGRVIEK